MGLVFSSQITIHPNPCVKWQIHCSSPGVFMFVWKILTQTSFELTTDCRLIPIKGWIAFLRLTKHQLSLFCRKVQTAYGFGWETVQYENGGGKKEMVFKVHQEENPLYGLIGNGNVCSFVAMVGGRGLNCAFLPVTLELLRHGLGVTDWKWLFRFCCSNCVKCHGSTQVTN